MSATPPEPQSLVDRIDAWLPQTQCTLCGYPRCRAYAEAIASGQVGINQCPPGGAVTLNALSDLLQVPAGVLDTRFGSTSPRARAVIDETRCIGCRRCIDVCPVDAIVGARQLMHTVIASECTGCALCLPPCPVDCIVMEPVVLPEPQTPWPAYPRRETERWRARTEKRLHRLAQQKTVRRKSGSTSAALAPRDRIRAEIRASVERVRLKKTGAKK